MNRANQFAGAVIAAVILVGVGYTLDCRLSAGTFKAECWADGIQRVVEGPLLAPLIGAGGFLAGFNIPNPRLDAERRRKYMAEQQEKGG
jgi:hypothetical protein